MPREGHLRQTLVLVTLAVMGRQGAVSPEMAKLWRNNSTWCPQETSLGARITSQVAPGAHGRLWLWGGKGEGQEGDSPGGGHVAASVYAVLRLQGSSGPGKKIKHRLPMSVTARSVSPSRFAGRRKPGDWKEHFREPHRFVPEATGKEKRRTRSGDENNTHDSVSLLFNPHPFVTVS